MIFPKFAGMSGLYLFVLASLALLIVPGPAVLYIVVMSLHYGYRAGFASVLGLNLGAVLQIMGVALGITAFLAASEQTFKLIQYLGAAYLVYLGIRTLLSRASQQGKTTSGSGSLMRVFSQGVVVSLLNPKSALFFFAFLPQFVDPGAGNPAVQVLVLGAIFVGLAFCTDNIFVLIAGYLGDWMGRTGKMIRIQRLFSGLVLLALGILAAFI